MTKSAHTRASLLPYPIIAAAVAGDAEAVSRVVRHYSSYIAALSTFGQAMALTAILVCKLMKNCAIVWKQN